MSLQSPVAACTPCPQAATKPSSILARPWVWFGCPRPFSRARGCGLGVIHSRAPVGVVWVLRLVLDHSFVLSWNRKVNPIETQKVSHRSYRLQPPVAAFGTGAAPITASISPSPSARRSANAIKLRPISDSTSSSVTGSALAGRHGRTGDRRGRGRRRGNADSPGSRAASGPRCPTPV
jgi:hypothetical protein